MIRSATGARHRRARESRSSMLADEVATARLAVALFLSPADRF